MDSDKNTYAYLDKRPGKCTHFSSRETQKEVIGVALFDLFSVNHVPLLGYLRISHLRGNPVQIILPVVHIGTLCMLTVHMCKNWILIEEAFDEPKGRLKVVARFVSSSQNATKWGQEWLLTSSVEVVAQQTELRILLPTLSRTET